MRLPTDDLFVEKSDILSNRQMSFRIVFGKCFRLFRTVCTVTGRRSRCVLTFIRFKMVNTKLHTTAERFAS